MFYTFVCWGEGHATMRAWELQLVGCGSLFLPRGSWGWTQVVRFGSKHPYQPSHLTCLAVCLGTVSGHSWQLSKVAVSRLPGCVLPITTVNASTRERAADSGSRKLGCKSLVSQYKHPLLFSRQCYVQWCREVQALITIAARRSGCALCDNRLWKEARREGFAQGQQKQSEHELWGMLLT